VPEIITDADLVSQFAAKAMEEPAEVIKTRAPSESDVDLPGGFLEPNGEVITKAEVKELTGADEEAVAKAGSTGKALNVLLQRGLVKLGSRPATKEDLDTLLSGDRDAILLGIRRVTFGSEIEVSVRCIHCADEHDTDVDLDKDVPISKLEDPINDRTWEVETKKGIAIVALPNGVTQRKLMENYDKTPAEINTLLLSGCLLSLDGSPSSGASTALGLGMSDRNKIVESIITRNPGPRLGEVTKACKACGELMELPLSLLDLFRI
jgi:hypothetical protein